MRYLSSVSAFACIAAFAINTVTAVNAAQPHNAANTISTEVEHPDSFRHFAPELPAMRERSAQINPDFGLHVSEIEPGLFFVTDLIYQSAFLITDEGVVVFDARSRRALLRNSIGAMVNRSWFSLMTQSILRSSYWASEL